MLSRKKKATGKGDKSAADKAAATEKGAAAENSKKLLLMLEEDDEFEEFEVDQFAAPKEDKDDTKQKWQEDWDDDLAEDDFIGQLRKELKL
ncbi:Hypothetical Protein FCC1311_017912 [Hondaea fermentalgiana]|uniref:26S proteasome complex subunit SEM1 n=1 Tax=Hondaea fermentalgiana TaxID=2315210 RepID=A0A2R5G3H8_9STRA|nr:Hypothetical Protein FCC1311_017912 [Hondaea fermentalgiana]|eukprot:GBG25572.1 Hypothetical Protein FCC1311_017912 [Hondaea fermentalgiana]